MLYEGYGDNRVLQLLTHSFPPRRSADRMSSPLRNPMSKRSNGGADPPAGPRNVTSACTPGGTGQAACSTLAATSAPSPRINGLPVSRSEEHTSELQSLMRTSTAVFCWQKKHHNQLVKTTLRTNYP